MKVTSVANFSGKILLLELSVKMLLGNQMTGFLNQLYLKKKMMNRVDFWHVDKDSRNAKPSLKILSWTWLKMLSTDQIPGFLNPVYPKKKKCSYKLEKHKRWFVNFWLVEVKNALGHLNCRILEPAIFQLKIDEST